MSFPIYLGIYNKFKICKIFRENFIKKLNKWSNLFHPLMLLPNRKVVNFLDKSLVIVDSGLKCSILKDC